MSDSTVIKPSEYTIWLDMRRRCYDVRCKGFAYYGKRGITMCEAWRTSFAAFIADVGQRPSSDHQIDRIDNDGNYEPGNVRWATRKEQCNNRRSSRLITFQGRTATLQAWADETGIGAPTIHCRLKAGWSVELALTALPDSTARPLTGKIIGTFTVLQRSPTNKKNWIVRCVCGATKDVRVRSNHIARCNCLSLIRS